MADQQQDQIPQKKAQGKTFWERLGVGQKAIIFLIVVIFVAVAWFLLFGGFRSLYDAIFIIVIALFLSAVGYIVLVAGEIFFRPAYFSPKEDYITRLINLAVSYCPDNLNNLYFRGSIAKKHVYGGKIIGCLGIPYLIGSPLKDEKGKILFHESEMLNNTKIPIFEKIEYGREGDTFFIYEKGFIFKKRHYLRCHIDLHSDLNGDVMVDDINPVPYGRLFEYPFKQLQEQAPRIMLQSQLESIIATHEHQGDLVSQATDNGLYYSPYFRGLQIQQSEIPKEG